MFISTKQNSLRFFHYTWDEIDGIASNFFVPGQYALLNGGAMSIYSEFYLKKERPITDLNFALLSGSLENFPIARMFKRQYITDPVHKWNCQYREPQIKVKCENLDVDIISRSCVRVKNQQFKVNFSDPLFTKNIKMVNSIPCAPLEFIMLNKQFQSRPAPKLDFIDLELIEEIRMVKRSMFSHNVYTEMKEKWLN